MCHANNRGWRGKEEGRRDDRPLGLEPGPNHKEPFMQPLGPQLVLIYSKEGRERESEREQLCVCVYTLDSVTH